MAPGVRRSEPAGARMVPPREGNEARGDGRRGIGAPHTTGEAGESCPRHPVEGRGRREMDPLAGKTANTPRLEPVSTSRQRIAELARHAPGMAWVIFIASWTNGYATARSEAICRGAGCGRTRTSGSVGGQGQQRPWSTRPQAAGKTVDKQSDIWSFGVVLFEMLTGHRLFTGETVSHVLASVLKTEPDWSLLPSGVPASLLRLLRRCLERDRRNRLHDVADARLERLARRLSHHQRRHGSHRGVSFLRHDPVLQSVKILT